MAWAATVSRPLSDMVRAWHTAGLGDPGFAVPEHVLTGEARDLHTWIDTEFTPRDRTADPRLHAELTPPHLRGDGEPAPVSRAAEGTDEYFAEIARRITWDEESAAARRRSPRAAWRRRRRRCPDHRPGRSGRAHHTPMALPCCR